MKTVAVITAYNEEATIGALIDGLYGAGSNLVLIEDGGSTDTTVNRALLAGGIVRAAGRRPIRDCLIDVWRSALDHHADRIVQIDAGGSHRTADMTQLLASSADLVIGSRFVKGSHYEGNPKRRVLSRLAGIACNLALPGACWADWTSGYRVLSRAAAEYLVQQPYKATMHGFQIEVLAHAARAGLRIEEVPITYVAGRSSFNTKVAREAFGVWWRLMKGRENPVNWAKPTSFGGLL